MEEAEAESSGRSLGGEGVTFGKGIGVGWEGVVGSWSFSRRCDADSEPFFG